jgi:WbqC-like protein family
MKLAVLQPGYLPWLGFFDQMNRADVFVYYDDVQYTRSDWRNRNRVKGPQGPVWLTVPVLHSSRFGQTILDAEIDNRSDWARKHRETLRIHYRRAAHFDRYWPVIEGALSRRWPRLVELDLFLTEQLKGVLGIETPTHRASELGVGGERVERLLALCRHFGATGYLTGDAAEDYLDPQAFDTAGVRLEYQRYEHPTYRQLYGDFVPYLSVLDLLFNCGPDSRTILASGGGREAAEAHAS